MEEELKICLETRYRDYQTAFTETKDKGTSTTD